MSELAEFFQRLDAAVPGGWRDADSAEAMAENARKVGVPHAQVMAERLDIDAEELGSHAIDRTQGASEAVLGMAARDVLQVDVLRAVVASAYAWGFFAGGLWEQERQMPRLEA